MAVVSYLLAGLLAYQSGVRYPCHSLPCLYLTILQGHFFSEWREMCVWIGLLLYVVPFGFMPLFLYIINLEQKVHYEVPQFI